MLSVVDLQRAESSADSGRENRLSLSRQSSHFTSPSFFPGVLALTISS